MDDLRYYFSRFMRRVHYFLVVATVISAVSVIVAFTLPPAYESEVKLLVESQQIPDELAQSTVSTPAPELLQILEQRLVTRQVLLSIARDLRVFPDIAEMNPDEIVQAMRAHTTIRTTSGREQATVMTITFEAYRPDIAASVLNAYLSVILEQDSEFRTKRAESTLEFFEQQVTKLAEDLDATNRKVLEFKNENADALPETLDFQMSERANFQERIARIDSDVSNLQNQREQLQLIYEATGNIRGADKTPQTENETRLMQLKAALDETLIVYSETSPRVRQLRARIAQVEEAIAREAEARGDVTSAEEGEKEDQMDAALRIQFSELDNQIAILTEEKIGLKARVSELSEAIAKTPANGVVLGGLLRDRENLQRQHDQAVDRLSQASTGERIEFLSRGQRITVVEPPAVPTEPTKPNRLKLAVFGTVLGFGAGLGLIVLLELVNSTPRRPEDIVARFDVMPIASIPYVRSRRQLVVERTLKLTLILTILVGVPVAIYAVHTYYLPLDLIADKVMNKLGVRL